MSLSRGALALGLAALLAAGPASAQPAPAQPAPAQPAPKPAAPAQPDYAAAKRHYQAAEEAAAKGDHATAAREYGIAFDITKDPVLFYKIGQAYERAGDCTSANVYYGRYLKEGNPSEEFKAKTEQAMAGCGKQKPPDAAENRTQETGSGQPATGEATAPARPAGDDERVGGVTAVPRSLEDEEPSWQQTAAWTSVGIGIALLTTGAVLGLSAASREEDVSNLVDFRDAEGQPATYTGATRDRYNDLIAEGDRLESLAVVAFAATGVAAASAALFFVLDARAADQEATALRPSAGPDGVGLTWGGRF